MNHERRLQNLETIWPPPAPRAHREPVRFDWNQLTEPERDDYADLRAALRAVDLGPVRLDERSEIRARLDALTDDQLTTLERLQAKVSRLTEEDTTR